MCGVYLHEYGRNATVRKGGDLRDWGTQSSPIQNPSSLHDRQKDLTIVLLEAQRRGINHRQ
jgi:hypothetical protein